MTRSKAIVRGRSGRLRKQLLGLARAASEVIRSGESVQRAFVTLAEPAMEALASDRVSLWERTGDDRLECRSTWPSSSDHAGLGRREATAEASSRVAAHGRITTDMPGWLGELAQTGINAVLDVPIMVGGEPWGRLAFESRAPRSWPPDEIAAARHFVDIFSVAIERDRRRAAEAQLAYLELYDETSGVANRSLFISNLRQHLKRLRRNPSRGGALLFIDVDRFHSVNEFFGEAGGNRALAVMAERLTQSTPDDALIGRLESDCFGVLLPRIDADWDAALLSEYVLAVVAEPIVLDGRSWEASASIGIAFGSPVTTFTVEEWLRNADLASKEAKQSGRNRVQVYDPEQHQTLIQRLAIEAGLREALREDRIEVAYQGEFDLASGEIVGAEALARWRHPDGALVAAGEFIDVAEATGLIEPIGRVVLARACQEAQRWPPMADGTQRRVRVNLSARQFTCAGLAEEVEAALLASGLHPCRLCLEITESTVMARAEESMRHLQALKRLGIGLAIDDFGTGYSSLSYLKRFPVDALKLDKSMVDGVESDATVVAILQAVQRLAHSLALEVVAEGIEHEQQIPALRRIGIQRVQGFHFACPEPGLEFRARLARAT